MPKDIAINYLISELPKISLDDVFPDNGRFLATVDGIELCNHKNRGLCEIVKYSDIQFGYYSTKMKNQSQRFVFMLSNRFKPGFMRWFYMHDGEKSNEIATALATVTHGVWKQDFIFSIPDGKRSLYMTKGQTPLACRTRLTA